MPRVLISAATLKGVSGPHLDLLRANGLEVEYPPAPWDHQLSETEILRLLPGYAAVLAGSEPYTDQVLARAAVAGLLLVARNGVGHDAVDLAAARTHGVGVTITPGANHETVAEHAFALLLALAKNLQIVDPALKQGRWLRGVTVPLRGRTLGLVGLGRIGKAMTPRARAFGMSVIAYDVAADVAFAQQHGIRLVDLEELLQTADVVSLHAPATPTTHHLINRQTLSMMKPTAFLLNTARGSLVDEVSLVEALRAGRIAGAGLDVFAEEPLPPNHPLLACPHVVITPHTGGTDLLSRADMAYMAAQAIVYACTGQTIPADWVVVPVRDRDK